MYLRGFIETLIEYYTGHDASAMTDTALAIKLSHIERIRKMEAKAKGVNF